MLAAAALAALCNVGFTSFSAAQVTQYTSPDGSFAELLPTDITVNSGETAEIFAYIGQTTNISGIDPSSSTLSGYTVTTSGNGSDTPLFIYSPANETAAGAVSNPANYTVQVSNLTVTNGLSHGGSSFLGGGGAGLGGGAFVGAGGVLSLFNVNVTGNTAAGGDTAKLGSGNGGGGIGGNSADSSDDGGGLFSNDASTGNGSFGEGGGEDYTGGFGGGSGFSGDGSGFGGGYEGSGPAGAGGGTEGGGAGLGGGIFVQTGGSITLEGNSTISGNTVTGGTNLLTGRGAAVGADIFMMTGSTVTLAPGASNTVTIGASADDASGQVSDVADDSVYGLPGGTYQAGSAAGAALLIGSASSPGGTVILHGNNTYAGGTTISNATTLEVFQDDNLGASVGAVSLSGGAELLTEATGFTSARSFSIGTGTLAAATGDTASYTGTFTDSGTLTIGDGVNNGMVELAPSGGFQQLAPTSMHIAQNAVAGFFGYIADSTSISGAGSSSSTIQGFTPASGNGSNTPLFIYNPSNETAAGAVASPASYTVQVSNLTVTNGLSQGGSTQLGGGGAGLGGGAFVGAGAVVSLSNVDLTGNTAAGGNAGELGGGTGGGGIGGNASLDNGGGLFSNGQSTDNGSFGGGSAEGGSGGFGGGSGFGGGGGGFGGGSSGGSPAGAGGGKATYSGGGAGLGGGIFVQNGGSITLAGNSTISGNIVTGGQNDPSGTTAAAAGADIFMMTGSTVTLAPGANNTVTIGASADDASGQVSDVADDSVYGLPGGTYQAGSAAGAALLIGNSTNPGGTVILHGNNTYAGGTTISNATTLEVFQDDNLGAPVGAVTLSGAGELLSETNGFTSARNYSVATGTLAAPTGDTASYTGTFTTTGTLTFGDTVNNGLVEIAPSDGFQQITPTSMHVAQNGVAGFFGYIGAATSISGAGSSSSMIQGFTPTSGNSSNTPLFIYSPSNETAAGAASSTTSYAVTVSSITITNGLSLGGRTGPSGGGGAGLGGGAFVGAGATLNLNNVNVSGNQAQGGSSGFGTFQSYAGGGIGGDAETSGTTIGGALFVNDGTTGAAAFGGGGRASGTPGNGGFGGGGGNDLAGGQQGNGGFGGGGAGVNDTGTAGSGGVGGGNGALNAGGGGAGLGGGVFVQNKASLVVTGNSTIAGNSVTPGEGAYSSQIDGANNGAAAGADLFMMSGSTVTLGPGSGNTIMIGSSNDDATGQTSDIADDSVYSLPGGTYTPGNGAGAMLTIGSLSNQGGTVILHGNNTYAGGTSIQAGATLEVFQDDNLGAYDATNPAIGEITMTPGVELLTNSTASDGFSTSRQITLGNSPSTADILAAVTGTAATYRGLIAGESPLTAGDSSNAGAINLTDANTYSGGTTVFAGFLNALNASGSATGTGALTIDSGATLGGTGFIVPSDAKNIVVNFLSGGVLSPSDGTGAESHLTFTLNADTDMNLSSGSKFVFDLGDSTADSDEALITGGTLVLHNQNFTDFTFDLRPGFGPGTYVLFDSTGGIEGSLGTTTGDIDGYPATLSLVDSNEELELTVVPEPATCLLLLLPFGWLAASRRRFAQ